MGCSASLSLSGTNNPYLYQVKQTWSKAHGTLEIKRGKHYPSEKLVVRRSGWKTIRVFVSSTFKDFHCEREVLVKKVFPDLRVWCEQRRLQLVDCDLRWGVPTDFNVEGTLRACLGEIDRCYSDNVMPFFCNMTSERAGWIPVGDEVPDAVREQYNWVDGLSVTEMEIMHGAYRNDNPNAFFLLRKSDFVKGVPEKEKTIFIDSNPIASYKLDILKKMIIDRFKADQLCYYDVEYQGMDAETGIVQLGGMEKGFSKAVFDFFKRRIELQYPLPDGNLDPYHQVKEQHESFMKNRSENVMGREDALEQIKEYLQGVGTDIPLVLEGGAGSGKSSLVAKAADFATSAALQGHIPAGGEKGWHVFYHFVGAVPGSTELESMLRRLLREMDVCDDNTMPKDLPTAAATTCGALNNPKSRPTIIIVDALNQFDEDEAARLVNWVPRKLAPHIRCVFSMIPDTPQHQVLTSREPAAKVMQLGPLDNEEKTSIIESMLGRYNKRLDAQQMTSLLDKTSSDNPLWLSIACEELRVFGQYKQVSDKINTLPDGLLELEMDVLSRFERENGGELLVGALCLLEASSRGLLEVELVTILGDEDNLFSEAKAKEDTQEKDDGDKEHKKKDGQRLPAYKWAEVYRALKPFLRPFGDSGEGRLDFYHRSLSKVVRKKYFKDKDSKDRQDVYHWWHLKLADYFEDVTNIQRKVEEYPGHLIALQDKARMTLFLANWEIFDLLFHEDYSTKLLYLWRTGSFLSKMESSYTDLLNNMKNSDNLDKNLLGVRYETVSRLLAQGGRSAKAKELLEAGMKLEMEELGQRDERMAQLHYLTGFVEDENTYLRNMESITQDMATLEPVVVAQAHIGQMAMFGLFYRLAASGRSITGSRFFIRIPANNQIQRQEGYYDPSRKPGMRLIIDSFSKACELLKNNTSTAARYKLGRIKNRLAFYYVSYGRTGSDQYYSSKDADAKAMEIIDEAIDIFQSLDDELNVGDSLTTKGVCYANSRPEVLKAYKEARAILIPKVGELHPYVNRLFHNMAIYYEEIWDYDNAFDAFYKRYTISLELYGENHPLLTPAIKTLHERIYFDIANRRGISVPSLPS